MLVIGAGLFEELTRVFLLTRLWNIGSSTVWHWFAIVLSAILFGLIHIYQGPAGAISVGISGLVLAVYYYHFGRVIPMMLSHCIFSIIRGNVGRIGNPTYSCPYFLRRYVQYKAAGLAVLLGSGTIATIIDGAIEVENVAQGTQIALRLSRQ